MLHHKFRNAEKQLKVLTFKIGEFRKKFTKEQAEVDLSKHDLAELTSLEEKLTQLRSEAQRLLKELKWQLNGGIRQYAKTRAERQSTYAQGYYGNIKGHNQQLQRQLIPLIKHLSLLIDTVKTFKRPEAQIAYGTAQLADHAKDKFDKTGVKDVGGDMLGAVVLLVALIKKFKA